MHKALHPRYNTDSLYMLRKEGGKGFASTEDSVDTWIRWLNDNIKKTKKG